MGDDCKRTFIHGLFTEIAPRYDQFNRLASFNLDQRWRRHAIREGGVRPGMRVLDVCTGSGDLALLCAAAQHGSDRAGGPAARDGDRAGNLLSGEEVSATAGLLTEEVSPDADRATDGLVVGLDFNDAMLHTAASKSHAVRSPVQWLRGDAERLPFQSESFDRIFIGFSTRNLSDLGLGIREMLRVLKAGGRLVVLETGRPSNPVVRWVYLTTLFTVSRLVGWIVTGRLWPFTYLARSVKGFLRPDEFVSVLKRCGTEAWYRPLSFGIASLYIADKPHPSAP